VFWSIIGWPFERKYRAASIAHDHYCITETRTWRDTHRMFYEAMRCSGVRKTQATVMYCAVYRLETVVFRSRQLDILDLACGTTTLDRAHGWEVSYDKRTAKWASWLASNGSRLVYWRAIYLCEGQAAYFRLEYDRSEIETYDSIISKLVKSLRVDGRCK
jgi:hypothetical protein